MGQEYPKRDQFFAHRFCRLVLKCCVANEHGQDVAMLLVAVAMTEDSKRYTGPVTFWNEQLAPLIGASNVRGLQRTRDKALEAGWLHYEPGARSRPAKYWVTIPDVVGDVTDGGMGCEEEELTTDSRANLSQNPSSINESASDSATKSTYNLSSVCRQSVVNLSNIQTLPFPLPKEEARAPEPKPEPEPTPKPSRKTIPPDFDELAEYCEQRGGIVDPQAFYDFYESKGWMVGKSKMRDWHAAVRTWEGRREQEQSVPKRSSMDEFHELYRPFTPGGAQ